MNVYTIEGGMLYANSYLVVNQPGEKGVLIDAGCSIAALNKEVEKHTDGIAAVLLTHAHFDHIVTIEKIIEIFSPKIYIHKNDLEMLKNPTENMSDRFLRKHIELKNADVVFSDGDEFDIEGIKIKAMHTPGHTMGSCIYLAEDKAFSGDTLFKGTVGRFDFPHSDFESLLKSLVSIKKEISPETIIYPGHGKKTTMKEELLHNPHLQF